MPLGRRLIDWALGDAGRSAGPAPDADRLPEPIDFIGLLKEAMVEGAQNITHERAIVPGHYTVLLHPDAHAHLRPLFEEIAQAAADELSREVGRLRRMPYTPPGEPPPKTLAPEPIRTVYPLDYTWSVEFCATLHEENGAVAPRGYMAVGTEMARRDAFEVVAEDGAEDQVRLTVKDPFSGVYETHFTAEAYVRSRAEGGSVTVKVPFGAPRDAPPPPRRAQRPSLFLTYRHPETGQTHRFDLAKTVTTVGRATEHNGDVDLRIPVEVAVSEEHAKLRVDPETSAVAVLDVSTHGTTVDGVAVPPSDPIAHVEHWEPVPVGATLGLGQYVYLTLHAS